MKSLDARSLTRLLSEHGGTLSWRDLLVILDVSDSAKKRGLRQVLKGMVRSGELLQDHQGAYHLPNTGGTQEGELELRAGRLAFNGLPVAQNRRAVLRAGDRVSARISGDEVQVLEVLERSSAPVIGVVRARGRHPYVESLSLDYKGRISLLDDAAEGEPPWLDGESVAVEVVGGDQRALVGRVIERLAGQNAASQAAETLLASHRVPVEWQPGVEAQAEKLPKSVVPGRHQQRRSLMDLPLVTIDGITARDFDDAVYAEKRRGGWRVIVAIADVAHYVKPGSLLDQSASERGNSVYLPDRVIPMLPEAISNGLCSLNPRVPRLAMVCDMQISAKGKVTGHEFYEGLIRSWQRLTYERVQEFLDEGMLDVEPEVSESLKMLQQAYRALRGARADRGALDFDAHEARLELTEGRITAIHPVHRLEAHQLIEEAMISANVCAAEFLESRMGPASAIYRVHEPPTADKLDTLRSAFALAGLRLPRSELTPASVGAVLDQLAKREDRWIFEMMVLRSLTQAVYTPENKGHFGLALGRYMHFTSPIRRYADLVVHRVIKAALKGKESPVSTDYLVETGLHISATERRAEVVSWGVDGWLKCDYVASRIGETFDGVVMGVTDFGLFVELKGYYVQGLLHISELGSDYFQFHQETLSLVGERSGRRFRLGDELRVVLTDSVPEQGRLDLVLAGARGGSGKNAKKGSKGGSAPGARPGSKRRRKDRR